MSLITRCPACNTLFKVVADQLRVSEGWVRCGQCNEIFDASAQLQEQEAPPAQKVRKTASRKSTVPDSTSVTPPVVSATAEPDTATPVPAALNEPANSELSEAADEFPPTEGLASRLDPAPPAEPVEPVPHALSFPQTKPASRWRRSLSSAFMWVLFLGLSLTLMLQWVVNERDRLVALEPELKPWMDEVCFYAECTVQPLRQIESIVINSSSFNKVRGDVFRLNFTLRNTASTALAHPAIELSITDIHDQVIMRRVFSADEIGPRSGILSAASESSSSLTLGIKTSGPSERIAGYRILAFYP